jgi:hypothetical protein
METTNNLLFLFKALKYYPVVYVSELMDSAIYVMRIKKISLQNDS